MQTKTCQVEMELKLKTRSLLGNSIIKGDTLRILYVSQEATEGEHYLKMDMLVTEVIYLQSGKMKVMLSAKEKDLSL